MWNLENDLTARNRLVMDVVAHLAGGRFSELERLSNGIRLSRGEMQEAVASYGRHLLEFPRDATDKIDYIVCVGSKPLRWSVVVPLFTREEGLSDLSLELALVEDGQYSYRVEIENIHVL
jgi:hypothetical protein